MAISDNPYQLVREDFFLSVSIGNTTLSSLSLSQRAVTPTVQRYFELESDY